MKTFKTIAAIMIVFGVVGIAFNMLFNSNIMIYLYKEQVPHTALTWYKLNLIAYKDNLITNINKTAELSLNLPTRIWLPLQGADWYADLGNNLALMLDYVILIINILLYPLRIGAYMLNMVVALLGFDVSSGSKIAWIGNLIDNLISNIAIPYI